MHKSRVQRVPPSAELLKLRSRYNTPISRRARTPGGHDRRHTQTDGRRVCDEFDGFVMVDHILIYISVRGPDLTSPFVLSCIKNQHTQRAGRGARAVEQMRAQGSQCKAREDEEWRYSLIRGEMASPQVLRSSGSEPKVCSVFFGGRLQGAHARFHGPQQCTPPPAVSLTAAGAVKEAFALVRRRWVA